MEKLLTIHEAAEILGLAPKTIYQYTYRHEIAHVKVGNRVRFRESDLQRWIDERAVAPLKK